MRKRARSSQSAKKEPAGAAGATEETSDPPSETSGSPSDVPGKSKEKTLLQRKQRDQKQGVILSLAQGKAPVTSSDMLVRTISGAIMIVGFVFIIACGHFYCNLLVHAITMTVFTEIIRLKRHKEKENELPLFFFLRWYFFAVTVFYLSRRFLGSIFDEMAEDFGPLAYTLMVKHHTMVSYCLFLTGMVVFVLTLRKFTLRYQFHQMTWTIMVLLIVVVQAYSCAANIYRGLIWFVVPQTLVIFNDIMAYFCGKTFGRTPLIALSPKKTWEGFIGGSIFTMLWGMFVLKALSQYKIFLCPQLSLIHKPFSYWDMDCELPAHYTEMTRYDLGGGFNIEISALQFHGFILGSFASLIAPFGGFIASGFKRAFKIKDFGDTIPGHGGITDRFDCHPIMGMFTYIYYNSFVSMITDPLQALSAQVISLPLNQRQDLLHILQESIAAT